jgi:hypothetical protein
MSGSDEHEKSDPPAFDVAVLGGETEDGEGRRVLRLRPEGASIGEVRPLKEGRPITGGEIIALKPREQEPWLCDVDVQHRLPARAAAPTTAPTTAPAPEAPRLPGPAQVATPAYRESWERIFGPRDRKGTLN